MSTAAASPSAAPTAAPSRRAWPPRWFWAIALAYLYVFPYYPKIQSANELPRAYLVKALVDHHRLSIDEEVTRWGSTADVSPWRGHQYSNKAPGTSLLTAPVYALAKLLLGREPSLGVTVWLGRLVTGVLPTLALLLLLLRALQRYPVAEATRTLVVVTYALGSMAMPYSLLFIAHQPSAVAVAVAWLLAQRVADEPPGAPVRRAWLTLALAGTAAGWAPLLDYQAAFALPPLAVLLGWRLWRRPDRLALFAVTALAAALPVAVLLGYHAAAFGSPWRTGYDASVTFAVYHQQGLLGITALRWEAFSRSMLSADTGLLAFSPWLSLAAPGLYLMWRSGRRAEAATLGAITAIYLLFLSSITFWRGGWQLGPRYIVVLLPCLLPPVALAVEALRPRRWGQVLVLGSCLAAVVVFAGSTAQFPYFPERFGNPVHELTLRLWREGLAAPNPLAWIGVPGPWSLVPFVVAVAVALAAAARGLTRSWKVIATALALAAALVLGGLTALARSSADPGSEQAYQWIRAAMTEASR